MGDIMLRSKIEFRVTAQCKRGCSFCLGINRYIPAAPIIDKELLKLRIDKLPPDNSYISVIGGEPLLHPDLPEIVAYLIQKGRDVVITTGGLPGEINPEMIVKLNHMPVHWCMTLHPPFVQDLIRLLQVVALHDTTPLALNYYHEQSFLAMKQAFLEKVVPTLETPAEIINTFESFCQYAQKRIAEIQADREHEQQVFFQDDYRFPYNFGKHIQPWFMPLDGRVARPKAQEKYEDYIPIIFECNFLNGLDEFTVREDGSVIPCCAPSQNLAGLVSPKLEEERNPLELFERREEFRHQLLERIGQECKKRGLPKLPPGAIYSWVCGEVCNKIHIVGNVKE